MAYKQQLYGEGGNCGWICWCWRRQLCQQPGPNKPWVKNGYTPEWMGILNVMGCIHLGANIVAGVVGRDVRPIGARREVAAYGIPGAEMTGCCEERGCT